MSGRVVDDTDPNEDRALRPYDVGQLLTVQTGELLRGTHLSLMQFARNNPNLNLHVELMGAFIEKQYVNYASNLYIPAGQTESRTICAMRGKVISGIIIFDTQNRNFSAMDERTRIKVNELGRATLTFEITAPSDKNLQCFALISCTERDDPCSIL